MLDVQIMKWFLSYVQPLHIENQLNVVNAENPTKRLLIHILATFLFNIQ